MIGKRDEIKTEIINTEHTAVKQEELIDQVHQNKYLDNNLINVEDHAEKNEDLKLVLDEKRLEVKKNMPDYNDKSHKRALPSFLTSVLKNQHKNAPYAANLLVDTYQAQNEAYYGGDGEAPSQAYVNDKNALAEYYERRSKDNNLSFKTRVDKESKITSADVTILVKDKKPGLSGDTASMQEVKERANLVQGLLKSDMTPYMKDGRLDAGLFDKIVIGAFDAAISSCNRYNELHRSPGSPWGKRRKRYVTNLLRDLQKERDQYRNLGLAIEMSLFTKEIKDIASPEELLTSLRFFNLEKVDYQKEGNSTDVYLASMEGEDGKMHKYYIKENLPLLDKDVDGFIGRRLNQLDRSEHNKDTYQEGMFAEEEAAAHMEEDRMSRAGADKTDYDNGKALLNFFKNRISAASSDAKEAERQYCADFFRYNFDKMFLDLSEYNAAIRALDERIRSGKQMTLEQWEEKAKTDKTAAMVVKILKDNALGVQKMKENTASEWMIKTMKLDRSKDAQLIHLLESIDAQDKQIQAGAPKKLFGRLEMLFRITMGKEVELYGQMMEGDKKRESDMAQYNTLTTSAMAKKMGFDDVIVNTTMGFAEFQRWDGAWTNGVITMQDVAYGQEFDEIVLSADDITKDTRDQKLVLSPDAMCQLTRLWAFDVFSNQTDRHGRNFKCVLGKRKDNDDPYVILSIKAYDHDQSQAPKNLTESFGMEYDNNGNLLSSKKNGFLQEPIKLVKKNTPMFYYIWSRYFGGNYNAGWTKNMKEPQGISDADKLRVSGIAYGYKKYRNKDKKDVPVFHGAIDLSGKVEDLQDKDGFDFSVTKRVYDTRVGKYIHTEFNCNDREEGGDIKKVYETLTKCIKDIGDFYLVDKPDEKLYKEGKSAFEVAFKKQKPIKDMSEEELAKLKKAAIAMDKLYNLRKEYGFSKVKLGGGTEVGDLEKWIDFTLYNFAQTYGQDGQVLELMYEKDMPDDFKQLMNQNGDLEVPTLLHMDKKAYDDLKAQIAEFENGKNKAIMRKYHMTEEQIKAAHDRLVQEVRTMEHMAEKAQLMLGKQDKKIQKFFLTKEEFSDIKKLTDLAIDPGNSYIAVDNEHFLYAQEDYSRWLDESEQKKGLEQRNKVLTDSKRLHGKPLEQMKCSIRDFIDFDEQIKNGRADVDWMQFKKDKEIIKTLWSEKNEKWRAGAKDRLAKMKEILSNQVVKERVERLSQAEKKLSKVTAMHSEIAEKIVAFENNPADQKNLDALRVQFEQAGDGKYNEQIEELLKKDNPGKKRGFKKLFITLAENEVKKLYKEVVLEISNVKSEFNSEYRVIYQEYYNDKITEKEYNNEKANYTSINVYVDGIKERIKFFKDMLEKDVALFS